VVLGEVVEIVDVGLVMPLGVDLHGLGIDVGLERVGRIGQRIPLERASGRLAHNDARHERRDRKACGGGNEMTSGHGLHGFPPGDGANNASFP
jgi:hypothetical protein